MAKITFFATSVDAIASVVIASGNFQGATAQLWFPPFKPNVYTQVLSSYLTAFRSPLTPLEKGGKFLKVPLFKGDLGGSDHLCVHRSPLSKWRGENNSWIGDKFLPRLLWAYSSQASGVSPKKSSQTIDKLETV
jgi:hypothetical protein